MFRGPLILTSCVLALLGCESAAGEDAPEIARSERAAAFRSAAVTEAIEAASEVVQTRGFATRDDGARGFLVEHTSDVRETPMRSGTCYVLIAAGSSAVRELDTRIYDSDGVEVAADADDGPRAALRFCPTQTGTYYATVRASAGSGLYEVRTFRGPTGLEIRTDDLFRQVAPADPSREAR